MNWLRTAILASLAAVIAYVIYRQLDGTLHPNGTTLALLILVVALLLGCLYPRELEVIVRRLTAVKVGTIELALRDVELSNIAVRLPEAEEFGTVPVPALRISGSTRKDLAEVRRVLNDRLAWLAAELGLPATKPAEIVQSLQTDGLLGEHQAAFAIGLLVAHPQEVLSLPDGLRAEYVERAWRWANRIRATVFDRAVRRDFEVEGWFIADFKQERPGHRPDFLAMADGHWLRVAPRVALTPDSATDVINGQIYKTRKRWAELAGPPIRLAARVIVIPTNTSAPESRGDPEVIERARLSEFLTEFRPVPS